MAKILLEQHYYGSAPIGLTPWRGFKSIAKSVELGQPEPIEDHCFYYRPTGKPDQRPVNWGWVRLADGRICIHRIGFSGSDDQNWPINFLAANFVAPKDSLDAIDYHIPSLIQWIAENNPDRYVHSDGKDLGFACHHNQLYEKQGWDLKHLAAVPAAERAKLNRLPTIDVPVSEVTRYSEIADDDLSRVWERLKPLRDSGMVSALFQSLLCRPIDRRMVVVVGAGDGENESAWERLLTDFLFTILRFNDRKALTYSTYFGQDASGGPFPNRRLIFTTKYNTELKLPYRADGTTGWLIQSAGAPSFIPQIVSPAARRYMEFTEASRWDDLLRLRDRASEFDTAEDADWLPVVLQTLRWATATSFVADDYNTFSSVSRASRESAKSLLDDAHRIAASAQSGIAIPTHPVQLVSAYIVAVVRLYPELSNDDRENHDARIVSSLAGLFDWCYYQLNDGANPEREEGAGEAIHLLFSHLSSDAVPHALRNAVLDACLSKLEAQISLPQLDDFGRCKRMWTRMGESDLPTNYVERTASIVAKLIFRFAESPEFRLAEHLNDFVVPVLAWVELPSVTVLIERLVSISNFSSGQDRLLVQFLVEARRNGKLTDRLLAKLAHDESSYLLVWSSTWREFAEQTPSVASILGSKLSPQELLASWWRSAPASDNAPLTGYAIDIVNAILAAEEPESRIDVAHEFLDASEDIDAALRRVEENFPPLMAIPIATAHFSLIHLILKTANEVERWNANGDWVDRVRARAAAHLGVVFGWLVARDIPSDDLNRSHVLDPFMALFLRLYRGPESRTQFVEFAAGKTAEIASGKNYYQSPILLEWRRRMSESTPRNPAHVDTESAWLRRVFHPIPKGSNAPRPGRSGATGAIRFPHSLDRIWHERVDRYALPASGEPPRIWDEPGTQFAGEERLLSAWLLAFAEECERTDWQPTTEAEGEWLWRLYCQAATGTGSVCRLRCAALQALLRPELAFDVPEDAFAHYFRQIIDESSEVWIEVANRLGREVRNAMTSDTLQVCERLWLGVDAPRRPFVQEIRRRGLLKGIGARLVAFAVSKTAEEENAGEGITQMRRLIHLSDCPELSEPARSAYTDVAEKLLKRHAKSLRSAVKLGYSSVLDSVMCERDAARICEMFQESPELLWDYWRSVGEWFGTLDRDAIASLPARGLVRLGMDLPASIDKPESEPWYQLFAPMMHSKAKQDAVLESMTYSLQDVEIDDAADGPFFTAAEAFVALAESLFRPVLENNTVAQDNPSEAMEYFQALATIFHDDRFPDWSEAIWPHIHQLPQGLELSANQGWNLSVYAAFASRARLLDALYWHAPGSLGRVMADWGNRELPNDPVPRQFYFTSFALVGYLTASGTDEADLESKLDAIVSPEFWAPFENGARDKMMKIINAVATFLPYARVDSKDVEYVVERLRAAAIY